MVKSMFYAKITQNAKYIKNRIDRRIFGSFVEHMGRSVYHGIYEPTHPTADANGFREDVKELVRELDIPIIRYPGGNFLSGYRWEDAVGPLDGRRAYRDAAWGQIEPNTIGTDEFHVWAKDVGSEVMMAVNLGTRGPEEAGALLEYCNLDGGSKWSDMRIANGIEQPYKDKVWCLGNEMDGPWQICSRTPEDYADIARKTASLMKKLDPSVELVACGSSYYDIPTFGKWELAVLEAAYDYIDFLSLHLYFSDYGRNDAEYLASAVSMESFIHSVISICDAVGGMLHKAKKINLSFDEWNTWPMSTRCDNNADRWAIGPAREEYTFRLLDALVFGTMLNTLLRNSGRVKMACMAQLVNVCAPIMTVPGGIAWKQTTYYPFFYASKYGRGEIMEIIEEGPISPAGRFGSAPLLDSVSIYNNERDEIVIFSVNRSLEEKCSLQIDFDGFSLVSLKEHIVIHDDDRYASNSPEEPERVLPHTSMGSTSVEDSRAQVILEPLSWNMLRFSAKKA